MKHMRLIILSFKKMKGAVFFLTIILTLALFVLLYLTGVIRYYGYSVERLEAADIEDSVYLKLTDLVDEHMGDFLAASVAAEEIYNDIKSRPGVGGIVSLKHYDTLTLPDGNYKVYAYDDQTLESFAVPVDGYWFSDTYTEDGLVQAVLTGHVFDEYSLHEEIATEVYKKPEYPIQLHVTGKTKFPWYILSFNESGTDILAHYLMQEENAIIVKDDSSLLKLFDLTDPIMVSFNSIVVFDKDVTAREKEAILNEISLYGSYNTYEDIISDSRKFFKTQLNSVLPIPLFLFFSAIVCLFSIASLYVLRNLENQVIYFLCGCSKRRSLLLMVQGLVVICLFPAVINGLFASIYPTLKKRGLMDLGNVIIDYSSISIILIFLFVTIFILMLIPYIISRKHSPQQMYRRLSE